MFEYMHRASVCFLVVLGLSACGGGDSKPVSVSSAPVASVASSLSSSNVSSLNSSVASSVSTSTSTSATPAKIEVTSTTVLLTTPNQTQVLKARVLDEKGNEIAATVTWESSNPAGISVDINGVVTAGGTDASAQITASIGTLKSIPLLVAYTQIASGAVLLTDAQIVGDPVETDPNAAFDVNNTYSIQLSGVAAPSVGQVVVNSGNKPVVGRVKAVSTSAGVHTVTLGMVSVKEALPNLHIKESFDLRNLPVQHPAAVLADYDVVREGSSFTYTPKADTLANIKPLIFEKTSVSADPASALASGEIGKSIQCEFTIEGIAGKGSPPIKLSKLPSLKVDFNPHMDLDYNPIDGLKVLMLRAQPTITINSTLEFDASIDPKLTCTLELETFVAPVSGPFAALLGPSVTFYGGIEASTKTSLKGVTLGAVATVSNTLAVGIRNCSFTGCSTVSEATIPKANVTTVMSELAESYRFEPSVFVYGMAKVGVANPLLKSLRVEAVYAKLGPAVNASLAQPDGQIIDPAYVSNYSIDAQLKAGLDTVFKQAAFFFGINGLTENLIDLKWPITQSPTGKATADVSSFKTGDTVNIDVKLDPENLMFLGFYNVKRVIILRKTGSSAAVEVASSTPNVDGAATFNLSYTAQSDGQSSELYAFVQTNDTILASLLNGLPLEIGQVNALNSEKITFMVSTSDRSTSGPYSMSLDGTGLTKIPVRLKAKGLSPDGKQVAYEAQDSNGRQQIFVRNTDGSGTPVQLTASGGKNFTPAWSPDGTRIAFSSTRLRTVHIFVMNANGSNVRQLTDTTDVLDNYTNNILGTDPSWSPDSTKIAYSVSRDDPFGPSGSYIAVLSLPNGTITRLQKPALIVINEKEIESDDVRPMWSPDGKKIAFESSRNGAVDGHILTDIYVMNADGSGMVRLTNNTKVEPAFNSPSWSPDSTKIVVSNWFDIFIIDATSGAQEKLNPGAFVSTDYLTDPVWIK